MFARAKNKNLVQKKEGVNWQQRSALAVEALLGWVPLRLQLGCWPYGSRKKILGVKMAEGMGMGNANLDHKGRPEALLSSFSFFPSFQQWNQHLFYCHGTSNSYTNMPGPSTTVRLARKMVVKLFFPSVLPPWSTSAVMSAKKRLITGDYLEKQIR